MSTNEQTALNAQNEQKLTIDQLKVLALKQRMGELVSDYEERIADLRANITQISDAMQGRIAAQDEEIFKLREQVEKYEKVDVPEED